MEVSPELVELIKELPEDSRDKIVARSWFQSIIEQDQLIPPALMGACPNCGSTNEMEEYLDGGSRDCEDCRAHFAVMFGKGEQRNEIVGFKFVPKK